MSNSTERTINVLFINNDGGGFAETRALPEGITAGELFARVMGTGANATGHYIRVNRQPVSRSHVLRDNDRVSITPVKVSGASDIEVLFINNDGGGFADRRKFPEGTTAGELFARAMGSGVSAQGHYIRVNRQPVSRSHVLQNGDRISITPVKVSGALAA